MSTDDIRSESAASEESTLTRHRRLASGRRIANLCLFAWLASAAFRVTEPPFGLIFFLCVTAASVVAVMRVCGNLAAPARYESLLLAASFVPLLNLVPVTVVSMRAAKELRAAGFGVGMLDARERQQS